MGYHFALKQAALLALWKWLSEGLISPYTLRNFHPFSFGTLVHVAEGKGNGLMEGRESRSSGILKNEFRWWCDDVAVNSDVIFLPPQKTIDSRVPMRNISSLNWFLWVLSSSLLHGNWTHFSQDKGLKYRIDTFPRGGLYHSHVFFLYSQFQFVNSYLSLFYIGFYLKDMERLKEVRDT